MLNTLVISSTYICFSKSHDIHLPKGIGSLEPIQYVKCRVIGRMFFFFLLELFFYAFIITINRLLQVDISLRMLKAGKHVLQGNACRKCNA